MDGYARVDTATPAGFELQVLMPRNLVVGNYELNPEGLFEKGLPGQLQSTLKWYVVWTGVEG